MGKRSDIHDRVLRAKSLDQLESVYSEWAEGYDEDLVDGAGYVAPRQCAETLLAHLPGANSTILDAGCGTGLVGKYLAEAGVSFIDGLDYSPDMLEVAANKGCYRTLLRADLNQPLEIPDQSYNATACVGTFTSGHVGPGALRELVRVTAPDGFVSFTVRDSFWNESGFSEVVERLRKTGAARIVSKEQVPYIVSEGSLCQQILLQAA
ncbi:class I SAM-dependent DNA methyltransferase [Congregibacter sp.]|uniref:class I SAM-dependent DNA methyltransferase n=1 Tax=Congregibacter sp. TaxID=2744308 RepID=UPI003F6A8D90